MIGYSGRNEKWKIRLCKVWVCRRVGRASLLPFKPKVIKLLIVSYVLLQQTVMS